MSVVALTFEGLCCAACAAPFAASPTAASEAAIVIFGCGHVLCAECADKKKLGACPLCVQRRTQAAAPAPGCSFVEAVFPDPVDAAEVEAVAWKQARGA